MGEESIVVECRDCEFRESFGALGRARVALDDHESETGHAADWEIGGVDSGVQQAGADAGVCGIPGCENPDTALLDWQQSEED